MSNVAESLVQTKQLVELFTKRLSVLADLAQLDAQIDAARKGGIELPDISSAVTGVGTVVATKKRGRPKGSTNKKVSPPQTAPQTASAELTAGKRFRNTDKSGRRLSLKELIITICARHRSGIKLDELVRKVHDFGYKSTSDDKGFVQNIRTNLHTLINSNLVMKDDDKKYHAVAPQEEAAAPPVAAAPAAPAPAEPAMAVA